MIKKIFIKEHLKSYILSIIILTILIILLCIVSDYLATHTLTKVTLKFSNGDFPIELIGYQRRYNLLMLVKKINFYVTIIISSIALLYCVLRVILTETKLSTRIQEFIKNFLLVILILTLSVVLNYVIEIVIGINVVHCWCNPEVIINV